MLHFEKGPWRVHGLAITKRENVKRFENLKTRRLREMTFEKLLAIANHLTSIVFCGVLLVSVKYLRNYDSAQKKQTNSYLNGSWSSRLHVSHTCDAVECLVQICILSQGDRFCWSILKTRFTLHSSFLWIFSEKCLDAEKISAISKKNPRLKLSEGAPGRLVWQKPKASQAVQGSWKLLGPRSCSAIEICIPCKSGTFLENASTSLQLLFTLWTLLSSCPQAF